MGEKWRQWAEHALGVMNRRGLLAPAERRALMVVRDSGDEPYHTLKRYVLSLGGISCEDTRTHTEEGP